ncbi:MAG: class I SAM-dependent methyltransferase [Pseudomonadota bacterium]
MAEVNTGFRGLLRYAAIYEILQSLMGAERGRRHFVSKHVRPNSGDVVVDIGCGPAELLRHMPAVRYFGYEPNPRYVERAKKAFSDQVASGLGNFQCKYFDEDDLAQLPPVDIAIVSAVLHHMDDEQAQHLFGLFRKILKPGGRVVTLDNVFVDNQNPIARFLISMDRGQNVRSPEGYAALAEGVFDRIDTTVEHRRFPPYTHFIMTAS